MDWSKWRLNTFSEDQLYSHTNDVGEAYLYSSFQIHLKTPCNGLEEHQVH
jgi:hypothetical protein